MDIERIGKLDFMRHGKNVYVRNDAPTGKEFNGISGKWKLIDVFDNDWKARAASWESSVLPAEKELIRSHSIQSKNDPNVEHIIEFWNCQYPPVLVAHSYVLDKVEDLITRHTVVQFYGDSEIDKMKTRWEDKIRAL